MARSLAATTRDADLHALATGGQPVVAAWAQISAHLTRRLSPMHAAILAEPNPDPARGSTDWYADGSGDVAPLDQAAPERVAGFEALITAIRAEAERLLAERDEGLRLLGDLIRLALEVPDRSHIRVRGDAIFLVAWGHHLAGRTAGAALLRTLPNTAPPMAMVALGAPPRPPVWPWALLAVALLALLSAIGAFIAWRDPMGWLAASDAQCTIDLADLALLGELDAVRADEATLRSRLASMAEENGRRRVACLPPPTPASAPTPSAPQQTSPLPPRADLPEERWNRGDLTVLEGCWSLASDYQLRNVGTGQIYIVRAWRTCFDRTGVGRQTLTYDDGSVCEGGALGSFEGNNLLIDDVSNVPCTGGGGPIERRIIRCERTNDTRADCVTRVFGNPQAPQRRVTLQR